MSACVCGADTPCEHRCPKHDRILHGYPCGPCQREWERANPKTAAAIERIAAGKGSLAGLKAARAADRGDA